MVYIDKLLNIKKNIGKTPLVELKFEYEGKVVTVYCKEEFCNPSGSIKIRPAYQILFDAIKTGKLKENQPVCEVTSGNMGISLAFLCKEIGNPINILMPKTMSKERIKMLEDLGAKVVLTNDFVEAFELQKSYEKQGYFLPMQFKNKSNVISQQETGEEIVKAAINFDAFISGVGTGGTLIGIGGYLKNKFNTKVIAIDPEEASLLTNGKSKGSHKIQGLSDQIIPDLYDRNLVDKIVQINSDDAIVMARKIKEIFDIGVGISSGANVLGAILSGESRCATVFADDDKKYKSTDLFNEKITSKLVSKIKFISLEKISN